MKKLFTNDKFFLFVTVLSVLCALVYGVVKLLVLKDYSSTINYAFLDVICIVVLYIAYTKHSKNVMKGMMGAVLAICLLDAINWIGGYTRAIDWVCCVVYVVLAVALFANHFVINSDRYSRPGNIKLNQWIVALIAINALVWDAVWLPLCESSAQVVAQIASAICFVCICASIVCVESRLDAYRLDREAAGWTEEKGYPEGYVRESNR